MSNPLSFDELQQTYDCRIPQHMLDMADGMGANLRQRNQLRALVRDCRRDARRAIKGHRDAVAGQFGLATLDADARYDWIARTLINARESWARYRLAQLQLRAAEGRMVVR